MPHPAGELINAIGFVTGAALYAMLLAMALRPTGSPADRLPIATAVFGLLWNLGALAVYELPAIGFSVPSFVGAAAFGMLGFLPAVVVHSVLRTGVATAPRAGATATIALAYAASLTAAMLHAAAAASGGTVPSPTGQALLTIGFLAVMVPLAWSTRRQPGWRRALWMVALAIFAVSALHLSRFHRGDDAWFTELVGHHASLPLAVAILYQDYPFALADLFLKRALTLVAVVAIAFSGFLALEGPMLAVHDASGRLDPLTVGALLGLWVATALFYPAVRRSAAWFVDRIVLRRADYGRLRAKIARVVQALDQPEEILEATCRLLAPALSTRQVDFHDLTPIDEAETWGSDAILHGAAARELLRAHGPRERAPGASIGEMPRSVTAAVIVPTAEPPRFLLVIGELEGGRRLFSDDAALLEAVVLLAARRIDAVRITSERYERRLREQEMSRLTTEAELKALRAQINPHFLFNALTTIGYLVQTAPGRALDTLLRLTELLRAVMRSDGELTTLGKELELVESYLDIERARFEERLRVTIDVPPELRQVRLPPLLLQPIVENAVKHGIAPSRAGGEVIVTARAERGEDGAASPPTHVRLIVRDTGAGAGERALAAGRTRGVGLRNVEQRLASYYRGRAALRIESAPGAGTEVEVRLPIGSAAPASPPAVRAEAGAVLTERAKR